MADFNNTTTKNGIIQKIEFITGLGDGAISGNATLLKQFTGLVNDWYGHLVGDIIQVDGRFEFDDIGFGDQPIATFNLVADQQGYSITEDADLAQILDITRIEVKNASDGDWVLLRPIDRTNIPVALGEYKNTSGIPSEFDVIGSVVNLYPAPSYSSTAGGKIYFKREANYFASTDTSQEPGILTPYQKVLWLGPAYDYSVMNGKPNQALRQEIELERERVREFYGRRNKYEQPRLSGAVRSSR